MSPIHLHLLVNHFPIIGLFIGLIILLLGVILKNKTIKLVSYFLLVFVGITAVLSNISGERSESIYEKHIEQTYINLNSNDAVKITSDKLKEVHENIEIHEHAAESLMPLMFGIIVLCSLAILLEIKQKSMAKSASLIVILIASIAFYFAIQTGNSGGKINHTELMETEQK